MYHRWWDLKEKGPNDALQLEVSSGLEERLKILVTRSRIPTALASLAFWHKPTHNVKIFWRLAAEWGRARQRGVSYLWLYLVYDSACLVASPQDDDFPGSSLVRSGEVCKIDTWSDS